MTPLPILADRLDANNLIVYVVVILLAGLLSLLRRAASKASTADKGSADRTAPPGSPADLSKRSARPVPPIPRRQPGTGVTRRATPTPGLRRVAGAVRRMPQATAVPQPQTEPPSWDVTEEVRRQQDRLEQDQVQRDQRLTTAQPAEADTAGIEARLLHIRPSAQVARTTAVAELLASLRAPGELRKAILHYEVFSPPKALRPGPELWDL